MVKKGPTLKVRFIVYPVIAGLFLLGCYLITLLALGYNLKLKDGKFIKEKAGAIILATKPGDAQVYLDGTPYKKKTPVFNFFDLTIDRVPVGKHSIRVEKEGYLPWSGEFEVKSGLVSWGNYILLLPQKRKYSPYNFENLKQVLPAKSQNALAVLTEDREDGLVAISVVGGQNKQIEKVYEERLKAEEEYSLVAFSAAESRLMYSKKINGLLTYFVVENQLKGEVYNVKFNKPIDKMVFNPDDVDELYILSQGKLWQLNYREEKVAVEVATEVVDLDADQNLYFVKNTKGNFGLWRIFQEPRMVVKSLPASQDYDVSYLRLTENYAILSKDTKDLFVLDPDSGNYTLKKIAGNVGSFRSSPNGKRIAILGAESLTVYDSEKDQYSTALSKVAIDDFAWSSDEGNIFYREADKLKTVNYNGFYINELAKADAFPIMISKNFNLYFTQTKNEKPDLMVFSYNL